MIKLFGSNKETYVKFIIFLHSTGFFTPFYAEEKSFFFLIFKCKIKITDLLNIYIANGAQNINFIKYGQ